jgi:integrase/recombinase XerD
MCDNSISLLRQRMIEDMTARRFREKVQEDYVRHVRTFSEFLGRSSDTATSADLRRFRTWPSNKSARRPSTPPSPRCGFSSPRRSNGLTSFVL